MSIQETSDLIFFCNGRKIIDPDVDPGMTLLSYLRQNLRLTGSKLGCGEGGCGACTVMISSYNKITKKITHISVNACLTPVCNVHLMAVTTVEGIGNIETGLHPVQERIAKAHGSQCGFCTPGIVMSMYTLLRNNHQPSMADVEDAFQGNLCRCTGYRPILEGVRTFTKPLESDTNQQMRLPVNCCKTKQTAHNLDSVGLCNGETQCCKSNTWINRASTTLFQASEFKEYDPSMDIIFPPELILMLKKESKTLKFIGNDVTWFRPVTLAELFKIRRQFPDAKLVSGNTEVGVEIQLKKMRYPIIISINQVTELNIIESCNTGIKIGASVTLSKIAGYLKSTIKKQPDYKCQSFNAIADMLHWFAGQQIRNVACLGGNIITGSPISDLNPILMAAGCTLVFSDLNGVRREVSIANDFFIGYRKTTMKSNETLISINVPYSKKTEHFKAYKQAHRRDDDIAIMNAAFRVDLENGIIRDCSMAFGGMAPTTKLATKTVNQIIGRTWDDRLLDDVTVLLADEMSLPPDAPGGMVEYRQSLVLSFFFKFFLSVKQDICQTNGLNDLTTDTSATLPFKRPNVRSTQMFQEVQDDQSSTDPIGRPMVHTSAYQQTTGEAIYVDDIVPHQNELYMGIVFSQKAHAKIISVDATLALKLPGVHAFVDYNDVTGTNFIGDIVQDEELFATDTVTCVGQYIGGIVADNQKIAQQAARMVHVKYEELEPIITIEDAIAKESYYQPINTLKKGNLTEGFDKSDQIIDGEMRVGEQEHFYLETQSAIALPKEDLMEIYSATQDLKLTQLTIANVLGVQCHKVKCRVKRLGGGFGGKETRSCNLSAALAVAAKKVGRAVRCMLDRDEDMMSSGTRHAFLGRYKVGFSNEGKIQAFQTNLYGNCGNSTDFSISVVESALLHLQNAYHIPNIEVHGYCCRTNIPSNTAFRGFGRPQSMMIVENIIYEIAQKCSISQKMVREINFVQEGDSTFYDQKIDNVHLLKRCWDECLEKSDFKVRQLEVEKFNRSHRWKKRGLSVIPLLYGVGFPIKRMNQAGAFVIIYKDGSVLLSHGGVEMGQGLYTKMIQIASRTLKIPPSRIYTEETSTNLVPNASPTAGSVSSDLNGMAVKYACEKIYQRLRPYMKEGPENSWNDWVAAAYNDRVSLSATGFYKTPDIGFDWKTKTGNRYHYYCYGASVSEVEIDCLTGDHLVLRTDIVMDVGDSINPAIDIGQIEGAFIQGYGLFTLEEHRWSPTGNLLTKGPGFYKIPSFTDIPVEFNVSLLDGVPNKKVVCSSKAIGEPPLFLAASIFFAIKEAILASREESGIVGNFRLDSPATSERIRMACIDTFTEKFPPAEPGTFTPFFIHS